MSKSSAFVDNENLVSLGQICKVQVGYAFKSTNYKKDGIPILRISNITDDGIQFNSYTVFADESEKNILHEFLVKRGDIVIALSGATTGKCTIYDKNEVSLLNQRVGRLRFLNEYDVNPSYVYYYLRTMREKILTISMGFAQPNLSHTELLKLRIPIPEISTQNEIVKILDTVYEMKRKRQRILLYGRELLISVFIRIFGDPMINPNNWKIDNLGKFLSFVTSGSRGWSRYYTKTGSKFIRVQNLDGHKLNLNDIAYVNPPDNMESKRTRVVSRDVLVSITGITGLSAVVPENVGDAYVSQHVAIMRIRDSINPYYLASFIMMPTGGQVQFSRIQYGQSKPGLNLDQIKSLKVVVPPLELQNKLENIIHKIGKITDKLEKSNTEFMYLHNALLQKAFTEIQ